MTAERPDPEVAAALASRLAALADAFRARLERDRAGFDALAAELAGGPRAADAVLADLDRTAHRLHGTAALFGYAGLGAAAGRLESAAAALREAPGERAAQARFAAALGALQAEIARVGSDPPGSDMSGSDVPASDPPAAT